MKIHYSLLLASLMTASLIGCGSDSSSNSADNTPDTKLPDPKVEVPKMIGTGIAFNDDNTELTIEHDTEGYAATMTVRVTKDGFFKELSFDSNIAIISIADINDAENGIFNIDVMSVATISADSISDPQRPGTLGNEVKTIFEAGNFEIKDSAFYQVVMAEIPGTLGIGTMTPEATLHVSSGDTPTLRLEQNASAGWSSQKWDLQANDGAFSLTNATSTTTPIKVLANAADSAIEVNPNGVSISGHLNLTNLTDNAEVSLTSPINSWALRNNLETGRLVIGNATTGINPIKIFPEAQENLIKFGSPAADVVKVNGDIQIKLTDGNYVSLRDIIENIESSSSVEFTHQ